MEKTKIAFFDIDGVLTKTSEYIPGTSPEITEESILIIKKFLKKDFKIVFITARSIEELRKKNGFIDKINKSKIIKKSLIYGALGLDQFSYSKEFLTKNEKLVFKKGDAVLIEKPVVKRETFSNLNQFLLYKMLLGKELKQQLKYLGFKVKSAEPQHIVNDARIYFEIENNTKKERDKMRKVLQKLADNQKKYFDITKKFGCPTKLIVKDITTGLTVEPVELGKHLGVLRALKTLNVNLNEKIIGYAFGDNDSDSEMKIRKDIKFIKVKNNQDFIEKANSILEK